MGDRMCQIVARLMAAVMVATVASPQPLLQSRVVAKAMTLARRHSASVGANIGMDPHVANQGAIAGTKANGTVSASRQPATTCVEALSSLQSKSRRAQLWKGLEVLVLQ